jgi:hypothetical protein
MVAIPETFAEFQALIDSISWPVDCVDWKQAANDLLEILEALRLGWMALQPVRLYLVSDSNPTLADWQSAWLKKGYELPISGNVLGLWEDNNGHSMSYAWVKEQMLPLRAYWWKGSTQLIASTPGMMSNSTSLTTTETQLLNQTWTLDRDAYIEAIYGASRATDTTTTLQWRASVDAANSTRGILVPNPASNGPRIYYTYFYHDAKLTSGSGLQLLFRTISGTGGVLRFTNDAATRKIEGGFYPHFLTENNVVMIKAVYL